MSENEQLRQINDTHALGSKDVQSTCALCSKDVQSTCALCSKDVQSTCALGSKDVQNTCALSSKDVQSGYGLVCKKVMQSKLLAPESKAIYAYLVSLANLGNTCSVKREIMRIELGMSQARFAKHMKPLIEYGIVDIERRHMKTNIYRITHKLKEKDGLENGKQENV